MKTAQNLDVRTIEPRLKHPTIFQTFDDLLPGESFIIVNDHDPKPLYYQFLAERPETFEWEYQLDGPEEWRVRIGKLALGEKTIGEMAAEDYRKALVFKKLGLDFCCGGKKTIEEAAKKHGVEVEKIKQELAKLDIIETTDKDSFTSMEPEELTKHIVERHHMYVREIVPQLNEILHKVMRVHGEDHPYLVEVYSAFKSLADELYLHMFKEEEILFPFIENLSVAVKTGGKIEEPPFGYVKNPISMMENEHESASEYLQKIRSLTSDFTLPEGACNSFRMSFGLLEEFEDDLHLHVHLENNILFPKAISLEKQYSE